MENGDEAVWDDYVCRTPQAWLFHLSNWKSLLHKTYGHETHYLMAKSGDEVRGILPLFIIRGWPVGVQVSSMPGGIYARDGDAARALSDAALAFADSVDADYLLLRDQTEVHDGSFVTVQRHCTQVLELPPDPDLLWKNLASVARNRVRKAEKSGLSVVSGRTECVDALYDVLAHHLRDLGTPIFGKSLLCNVVDMFPENVQILVAKYQDRPVGAIFLLAYKQAVHMQWLASRSDFFPLCPNDLLCWEALSWACQHGYGFFDFGRSQWKSGTWRFKAKWGSETHPLYYQYYLRRGTHIPDLTLKVERVFYYRLATEMWRRMPVRVTRAIGPILRKYVSPI